MSLEGRVALVTGAASGIGRALVHELQSRGARVVALDVRDLQDPGDLGDLGDVRSFICDVCDEAAVDRVATEVEASVGPVDMLFVNAGVATAGAIDAVPVSDARWVLEVNALGALIVARRFVPAMRRRGQGRVVFTGSIAGLVGVPDMSAYAASKHAMVGFAESLRSELLGTGVTVTTICPGYVRTGLHRATRYHESAIERLLDEGPLFGLDAETVARRSVDAALRGRGVVPMGIERWGAWLARLSPDLYARAAASALRLLRARA